jgi:hypothetical protein
MLLVIPAPAEIQTRALKALIPACMGMTAWRFAPDLVRPTPYSRGLPRQLLAALFNTAG